MDAVRSKETILDSLPETVFVEGISKIEVGVAVVDAERSRGHAELVRWFEVFKDHAPRTIISRATPMALVDDHQIKEVGQELLEEARTSIGLRECLVDCEVHLAALDDLARLDLVARI